MMDLPASPSSCTCTWSPRKRPQQQLTRNILWLYIRGFCSMINEINPKEDAFSLIEILNGSVLYLLGIILWYLLKCLFKLSALPSFLNFHVLHICSLSLTLSIDNCLVLLNLVRCTLTLIKQYISSKNYVTLNFFFASHQCHTWQFFMLYLRHLLIHMFCQK
jgi:hypothetical protein